MNGSLVERGQNIPENRVRNLRYMEAWGVQREHVVGTEDGYGRGEGVAKSPAEGWRCALRLNQEVPRATLESALYPEGNEDDQVVLSREGHSQTWIFKGSL